jgi:Rrf2 family protein
VSYQRSTRYGLYAAIEMARAANGRPVTAAEVAAKYALPPAALAKAIQRLVKGGVAVGTRGTAGGYRLARPAAELTVLDVVEVFETPRRPGDCLLSACAPGDCRHVEECRLRFLFDEVDQQARATFASVSIATLVAPPRPLVALALPRELTPTRSSPAASK